MALSDVDKITTLHKNNEAQFLCFRLDKDAEIYAINVFKVQEIIQSNRHITIIDHDDGRLLDGIFTFRDKTVPLVDLKKWFHYDSNNPNGNLDMFGCNPLDSQIMLCDFSGVLVGIRIYQADKILTKHWSEINPAIKTTSDPKRNKINNNTRYEDGELVQIVDIEKMISEAFPFLEEDIDSDIEQLVKIKQAKGVLIAEDSTSAQNIMKRALDKLDIKFSMFENGGLLLRHIEAMSPDELANVGLVITDLEMPEVSGFEVIKKLRSSDKYAHIAIAVNSSMSGSSNEDMSKSLGADAFLPKTKAKDVSILIAKYCQ